MKKAVLFISLFLSVAIYGQKRISAVSSVNFDETGLRQFVDSTTYGYTGANGSIPVLVPKFQFAGGIFGFLLDDQFVHCNVLNNYNGAPSPVALTATINNTLTNNLVTQANQGGFTRTLYQYNANGKFTSEVVQNDISGIWVTTDSTAYTYDALGNQLTRRAFVFNTPNVAEFSDSDSSFYAPGTSRLTKYNEHSFDFATNSVEPLSQSLISYTGMNIQRVDLYLNTGSGTLEWLLRINYSYTGALATSFTANTVVGGFPLPLVFASGTFTYTPQNQPLEQAVSLNGTPSDKSVFTYDADGYIKTETNFTADTANVLYIFNVRTFYYQSTVGLENLVDASVSIFPNPAKDVVKIHSTGSIQNVQVLNLAGQQVLEQKTPTIDVQHLPAGTYIINGTTDKGSFSKKIVKE